MLDLRPLGGCGLLGAEWPEAPEGAEGFGAELEEADAELEFLEGDVGGLDVEGAADGGQGAVVFFQALEGEGEVEEGHHVLGVAAEGFLAGGDAVLEAGAEEEGDG